MLLGDRSRRIKASRNSVPKKLVGLVLRKRRHNASKLLLGC
jgi:hypothetical protein